MCGIAGVYNLDGQPAVPALLTRMARVIGHRGPDQEGIHTDGNLGLVFRRLAIIDLSAAGHQPMSNEDGTVWLLFNGEIYNYRELAPGLRARGHVFRSRTDSEVILHAYEEYGEACLQQFNGMFAIAIWDSRRRVLWIARDRLGVKPLYYTLDGHRFAFASEIKALRECASVGTRANPHAIVQYLRLGYSIDDQTWFQGVRKLMPGCVASISEESGLHVSSYWDPIEIYRNPEPASDYPERIRELLHDSVRLQLRSDVALGAHLSGGLDSSSVVALMSQEAGTPINTFGGAFEEGGQYDERHYSRQMVARYQTVHHEVQPGACELPRVLPRLIWHMDEPAVGPGLFPQFVVCRLTAQCGVKVVNGGQGGDELFGGYVRYLRLYLRQRLAAGAARTRARELAVLGGQAPRLVQQVWSSRRPAALLGKLYVGYRGGIGYHPAFAAHVGDYQPMLDSCVADPVASAMYNDVRYYLPALLQVEDRTSMAVSIESRVPLLDYRLVELAAAIPIAEKFRNGELKHLLRRAMRDALPSAILNRHDKRGFPTPISLWFRHELADWVEELLVSHAFRERRVFCDGYLAALLAAHRSGLMDTSPQLWAAANIALWFEQFNPDPTW